MVHKTRCSVKNTVFLSPPDFRLSIAWLLRCPFDGAGDMVQLQSKLEALPPSHGKAEWDGKGILGKANLSEVQTCKITTKTRKRTN